MTECQNCKNRYEETEMNLIQEDSIIFLCNICKEKKLKEKNKLKPRPFKVK